jgi:DNA-binding CsgD family transcriptional regulator
MARAGHRQLEMFSKAMLELYRCASLETLAPDFLRALGRLVPSDFYVMNWVEKDSIPRIFSDRAYPVEARIEIFNNHVNDHPTFPLVAKYAQTRDPDYMVGRWSDFTTVRQFRKTGLHRDFFRPLETNHQLVVVCPGDGNTTNLGVTFQRASKDFSDEEMLLLRLAGPHLEQVYLKALLRSQVEEAIAVRELALDEMAAMVVTASAGSEAVLHCSPKARRLCEWHFAGESPASAARRILRDLRARKSTRFLRTTRGEQLVVDCRGPVWRSNGNEEVYLLQFAEKSRQPQPASLERLGLTPREAEVLAWIAEGKTNEEIAIILGARANTVRKHVENIHRKLGVENRGAAAAIARELG